MVYMGLVLPTIAGPKGLLAGEIGWVSMPGWPKAGWPQKAQKTQKKEGPRPCGPWGGSTLFSNAEISSLRKSAFNRS
jgi:hypothetical protein